jgi:hypothetical protein
MSKHDALLNADILRCIDCYYVIINQNHNGISNKIRPNHVDSFTSIRYIQFLVNPAFLKDVTSNISKSVLGPIRYITV